MKERAAKYSKNRIIIISQKRLRRRQNQRDVFEDKIKDEYNMTFDNNNVYACVRVRMCITIIYIYRLIKYIQQYNMYICVIGIIIFYT